MMKKHLFFILLFPSLIFAQQDNTSVNKQVIYPGDCASTSSGKVNPVPLDGNGSLGLTFSMVKCGLNYVQVSHKLGQRFTFSCCPSTNGIVQPATYTISGIPSCAVIEKAYVWSDCSGNG